jgi:hypothetical protein
MSLSAHDDLRWLGRPITPNSPLSFARSRDFGDSPLAAGTPVRQQGEVSAPSLSVRGSIAAYVASLCDLGSVSENIAKHHGFVVNLVARRIDEREPLLSGNHPKLVQESGIPRQFGSISTAEPFPPARIVPEPAAELSARRDLLQPSVDSGVSLPHAARPEPIHQNADTVFGRRRQIGTL